MNTIIHCCIVPRAWRCASASTAWWWATPPSRARRRCRSTNTAVRCVLPEVQCWSGCAIILRAPVREQEHGSEVRTSGKPHAPEAAHASSPLVLLQILCVGPAPVRHQWRTAFVRHSRDVSWILNVQKVIRAEPAAAGWPVAHQRRYSAFRHVSAGCRRAA